jgi:hypothetical protein
MAVPKLIRNIKQGDVGPDVLAVKRALKAAGFQTGISLSQRRFGSAMNKQLRRFQLKHSLPVDGVYGQRTHAKLWSHFDNYGKELMTKAPKQTPQEKAFAELIMWCEAVTRRDPPYVWGGGHGVPLDELSPGTGMDCSSSTSLVLSRAGLFESDYAWVSGTFASNYGYPGMGEFFTVYANNGHVFIRFHKGRYWRFDTSPQGDGGRGPELRRLPRFTRGFYARRRPGGF